MDVTHTSSLENARPPAILYGQIQQLTTEGKTDLEIAGALSIGVGQVRRIALKNGLKLKREAVSVSAAGGPAVAAAAEKQPELPHTEAAVQAAVQEPKKQRRPRVTSTASTATATPPKATDFASTSGIPGELLMLIGEITLLANRNSLSPEEFIDQCRGWVDAWDRASVR
jgi:hypothetical protein